MQYSHQPQTTDTTDALPQRGLGPPAFADPEADALQPLVRRTCQALRAMVSSVEALENVLCRIDALAPDTDHHAGLMRGTEETVAHMVALLRREGPPLLFRAQALRLRLRLHGHAAGNSAAIALRALHADLDGLASFKREPAVHWVPVLRRARTNIRVMLVEFDDHAQQIASELASGQDAAIALESPLPR